MIRTDISRSHSFATLTPDSQRLFILLIPHFNSHGKMTGGAGYVKDQCVPLLKDFTHPKIEKCLKEITQKTNVKRFEHQGLMYIHAVNWSEHQELRDDRLGFDDLPSFVPSGQVQDNSGTTPGQVPLEVKSKLSRSKVEVEVEGNSTKTQRFSIPTPEEVTSYAKTISFNLDGGLFCDYYAARGWKLGKETMKNWQAAVRTWKRKDTSIKPQEKPKPMGEPKAGERCRTCTGRLELNEDIGLVCNQCNCVYKKIEIKLQAV